MYTGKTCKCTNRERLNVNKRQRQEKMVKKEEKNADEVLAWMMLDVHLTPGVREFDICSSLPAQIQLINISECRNVTFTIQRCLGGARCHGNRAGNGCNLVIFQIRLKKKNKKLCVFRERHDPGIF